MGIASWRPFGRSSKEKGRVQTVVAPLRIPDLPTLVLLVPDASRLGSFRFHTFEGPEEARLFIGSSYLPGSDMHLIAFWAAHCHPEVDEETGEEPEVVVMVRDPARPGVVDPFSFTDMPSAQSFLREHATSPGLEHWLLYWATPILIEFGDLGRVVFHPHKPPPPISAPVGEALPGPAIPASVLEIGQADGEAVKAKAPEETVEIEPLAAEPYLSPLEAEIAAMESEAAADDSVDSEAAVAEMALTQPEARASETETEAPGETAEMEPLAAEPYINPLEAEIAAIKSEAAADDSVDSEAAVAEMALTQSEARASETETEAPGETAEMEPLAAEPYLSPLEAEIAAIKSEAAADDSVDSEAAVAELSLTPPEARVSETEAEAPGETAEMEPLTAEPCLSPLEAKLAAMEPESAVDDSVDSEAAVGELSLTQPEARVSETEAEAPGETPEMEPLAAEPYLSPLEAKLAAMEPESAADDSVDSEAAVGELSLTQPEARVSETEAEAPGETAEMEPVAAEPYLSPLETKIAAMESGSAADDSVDSEAAVEEIALAPPEARVSETEAEALEGSAEMEPESAADDSVDSEAAVAEMALTQPEARVSETETEAPGETAEMEPLAAEPYLSPLEAKLAAMEPESAADDSVDSEATVEELSLTQPEARASETEAEAPGETAEMEPLAAEPYLSPLEAKLAAMERAGLTPGEGGDENPCEPVAVSMNAQANGNGALFETGAPSREIPVLEDDPQGSGLRKARALRVKRWVEQDGPFQGFGSPPGKF